MRHHFDICLQKCINTMPPLSSLACPRNLFSFRPVETTRLSSRPVPGEQLTATSNLNRINRENQRNQRNQTNLKNQRDRTNLIWRQTDQCGLMQGQTGLMQGQRKQGNQMCWRADTINQMLLMGQMPMIGYHVYGHKSCFPLNLPLHLEKHPEVRTYMYNVHGQLTYLRGSTFNQGPPPQINTSHYHWWQQECVQYM